MTERLFAGKSIFVMESWPLFSGFCETFAVQQRMKLVFVPEVLYPKTLNGFKDIIRGDSYDYYAIHTPKVASIADANLQVKQIQQLEKGRVIVMAGEATTKTCEYMYLLFQSAGIPVVEKGSARAIISEMSKMQF